MCFLKSAALFTNKWHQNPLKNFLVAITELETNRLTDTVKLTGAVLQCGSKSAKYRRPGCDRPQLPHCHSNLQASRHKDQNCLTLQGHEVASMKKTRLYASYDYGY